MNFLPLTKQRSPKEGERGLILLTAVIVLAGIILVLLISTYFSINAIRWQAFALPRASQSFANAESCLAILTSKLSVSPAYNTQGNWRELRKGDIFCRYFIEDKDGQKTIKIESSFSDFFRKIFVQLEMVKK